MLKGNITFTFKNDVPNEEAFYILKDFIRTCQKYLGEECFEDFESDNPDYSIVRNTIRINEHHKL